jgi:ABC-type uncharacterized transport system substrate-binding protein
VTGLANFAELLASKQLDFLRELLPRLSRVAMLVNTTNPLHVPQLKEMQAATANASLFGFMSPRPGSTKRRITNENSIKGRRFWCR